MLNSFHLYGHTLGFQPKELKVLTTLYGILNSTMWKHCSIAFMEAIVFLCINSSTSALGFFRFLYHLLVDTNFVYFFSHGPRFNKLYFFSGFTANWFVSSPEGLRNARTLLLVQFAKDDKFSSYFRIIFSNSKLISLLEDLRQRLDHWTDLRLCDLSSRDVKPYCINFHKRFSTKKDSHYCTVIVYCIFTTQSLQSLLIYATKKEIL